MIGAIAIGIGCKSDASCEAILRVIRLAMAQISDDLSYPSLRAQRSHPGAAAPGPWMASSQELLATTVDVVRRGGGKPCGLYTHERKTQHPALRAAAAALGLDLIGFSERELETAEPRLVSRSPRVAALTGVGSVAEAAALLGAGADSRIIVAKLSAEGVSCAIAAGEPA